MILELEKEKGNYRIKIDGVTEEFRFHLRSKEGKKEEVGEKIILSATVYERSLWTIIKHSNYTV